MSGQVVFATKALGTVLAQEVLPACVHHQVPPDILAGVEAPVTVVTWVFLFLHAARWPPGMGLEVLQEDLGTFKHLHAHFAAEVAAGSRMHGQVTPVAQLGVVVLATLWAVESFFVGVMRLKVIAEVVLAVEHFLTVHALVGLLGRVGGQVPSRGEESSRSYTTGLPTPTYLPPAGSTGSRAHRFCFAVAAR